MIKNISILISSIDHPVNSVIEEWVDLNRKNFDIEIVLSSKDLSGGDLLFLVSCGEIVCKEILAKYDSSLVIHASNLPKGRGFSPHIWDIINGSDSIFISLLEASEKVDRGNIWKKVERKIPRSFLYDEIISIVNFAHIELMNFAVANFDTIIPEPQSSTVLPTYYKRRSPEDSKLDVNKSIKDQFNLLRVCDAKRFPAFFVVHGRKYKVILESYEK
tara:strand:+ start:3367 stop:4017 length:651 start_codon:yes stop_codon:yes gene_type:complete